MSKTMDMSKKKNNSSANTLRTYTFKLDPTKEEERLVITELDGCIANAMHMIIKQSLITVLVKKCKLPTRD